MLSTMYVYIHLSNSTSGRLRSLHRFRSITSLLPPPLRTGAWIVKGLKKPFTAYRSMGSSWLFLLGNLEVTLFALFVQQVETKKKKEKIKSKRRNKRSKEGEKEEEDKKEEKRCSHMFSSVFLRDWALVRFFVFSLLSQKLPSGGAFSKYLAASSCCPLKNRICPAWYNGSASWSSAWQCDFNRCISNRFRFYKSS